MQWYVNAPTVAKTRENDSPVPRSPESQSPVLDVLVCESVFRGSQYTHFTVIPFRIVMFDGRNWVPDITTRPWAESAKLLVVGTAHSPFGATGLESDEQAAAIPRTV